MSHLRGPCCCFKLPFQNLLVQLGPRPPWTRLQPLTTPTPSIPGTSAGQSHIFLVAAVVLSPCPSRAVAQRGLSPLATHIIQPDGPSPWAIVGFAYAWPDPSTAQLPAGYSAIPQIPVVIAHCPPASSMPHLQPASTPVGSIGQTNSKRAYSGRSRVKRGQLRSASPLYVPSTHLTPQRCLPWGRGVGLWMTLENLLLGSRLRAPQRPKGFA